LSVILLQDSAQLWPKMYFCLWPRKSFKPALTWQSAFRQQSQWNFLYNVNASRKCI